MNGMAGRKSHRISSVQWILSDKIITFFNATVYTPSVEAINIYLIWGDIDDFEKYPLYGYKLQ